MRGREWNKPEQKGWHYSTDSGCAEIRTSIDGVVEEKFFLLRSG
jgi:hypothetical protein